MKADGISRCECDLDGVLVDSPYELVWREAFNEVMVRYTRSASLAAKSRFHESKPVTIKETFTTVKSEPATADLVRFPTWWKPGARQVRGGALILSVGRADGIELINGEQVELG